MTVPKKVAESLKNAVASRAQNVSAGRTFEISKIDGYFVRSLRSKLGLSQAEFAIKFGFSIRTLQKWETGERCPEGPARAYLMVISEIPEQVSGALLASDQNLAHELDLTETR